jgi:hypothetical protein
MLVDEDHLDERIGEMGGDGVAKDRIETERHRGDQEGVECLQDSYVVVQPISFGVLDNGWAMGQRNALKDGANGVERGLVGSASEEAGVDSELHHLYGVGSMEIVQESGDDMLSEEDLILRR